MRLKNHKQSRKLLTYFRATHGFRPPFDVLIDGTAIQACINHGVGPMDALTRMLGDRVRISVPRAAVAELHALGRKFAAASKVARRLKIVDADTPTGKTATADAVAALVDGGNPQRYFVLTEDPELRERLGAHVAVPQLRFARGGRLVLEAPGRRGESSHGNDFAAPAKEAASKPRSQSLAVPAPAATESEMVLQPEAPRKRKRSNEPNPLSVKKKKKTKPADTMPGRDTSAPMAADDAPRKARRRKRHGVGSSGEAV